MSDHFLGPFDYMKGRSCQRGSRRVQTGVMVYRMDMAHAWLSADHPRWRRRKAKPAKSGLQLPKAFNFMLWRSRGAIGRVRAAPGAPATAAEGMDGSDVGRPSVPPGGRG